MARRKTHARDVGLRLRAAQTWVLHDDSFANLAFADSTEDPAAYIVITRTLAPAAIDRRLRMDGVYVEIDDQGSAAYRAATGYALERNELRISISPDAYDRLGIDGDIVIELADPDVKKKKLRAALIAALAAIFEPSLEE